MKFRNAYNSKLNDYVKLEEVIEIYKNNKQLYKDEHQNNLYCPECHQAQLSYHNGVKPYLSTYPKAKHQENCPYTQNLYSQKQIKVMLKANNKTIENQIESVLTQLIHPNETDKEPKEKNTEKEKTLGYTSKPHYANKQIQHKSLNRKLTINDCEVYKIFYGEVNAKWKIKDNNITHCLCLYNNKNKLICEIGMSENIYSHCPKMYKEKAFHCYISFLGYMKKLDYCYFTKLMHSKFLKIEKL